MEMESRLVQNKTCVKDDEFFLDSENYWKNDFKAKFVEIREESELWECTSSYTSYKTKVYCDDMVKAFKIVYTSQQMVDDEKLDVHDVTILSKALDCILGTSWRYSVTHINRDTGKVERGAFSSKQWRDIMFNSRLPDYMESRHQNKLNLMHTNNIYTDVKYI